VCQVVAQISNTSVVSKALQFVGIIRGDDWSVQNDIIDPEKPFESCVL